MAAHLLDSLFHLDEIFNLAGGNLPVFVINESGPVCSSNAMVRGCVWLRYGAWNQLG